MKLIKFCFFGVLQLLLINPGAASQSISPKIAVGSNQSLVLTDDGSVYTFGDGTYGTIGQGHAGRFDIAAPITDTNLGGKKIIASATNKGSGDIFTLLLAEDSTVYSFGVNDKGQLGHGDVVARRDPTQITHANISGKKFVAVAAGDERSFLLTSDGLVFGIGSNINGYLGIGSTSPSDVSVPTLIDTTNLSGHKIAYISAGVTHTLMLSDSNYVFAFGSNSSGELGNGLFTTTLAVSIPKSNFSNKTLVDIQGGTLSSMALADDGTVFSWGNHRTGLGLGSLSADVTTPTEITHANLSGKTITKISKTDETALLLASDGTVFIFGDDFAYDFGFELMDFPTEFTSSSTLGKTVSDISMGRIHGLILASDGTVFGFGLGAGGRNGVGTEATINAPRLIDNSFIDGKVINQLSAGTNHSILIDSSGVAYSFGGSESADTETTTINSHLGRSFERIVDTPTKLTHANISGKNVVDVKAGGYQSFLLTEGGEVFAFGSGLHGRLGTGDSLDLYVPTLIDHTNISGKKVVDIATSTSTISSSQNTHTLFLTEDGKIFATGSNSAGQLGLGDYEPRFIPTEINHSNLSGKTITSIAANAQHSMAIASDGTVYLWGAGINGEMGFGNTDTLTVPTAASHVNSLGKIFIDGAIGQSNNSSTNLPHFMLVTSDSTVYSFGENADGQLGQGNKTDNYVPTQITSTNIAGKKPIAVEAGVKSSMLLMDDGSVYSFGNTHRVGIDGSSFSDKTEPTLLDNTEILGKQVTAIAAKDDFGLAILDEGTILSFGSNSTTFARLGVLGNGLPESGDETPQPIANFNWLTSPLPSNNLALHLDAGRGFTTSNDSISVWADLSGNDHDATQDDLSRRPVVQDSAINGRAGLRIHSGLNYITMPTTVDLGIQNNDYEAFIVAKTRTSNSSTAFLMAGSIENFELHVNGSAGARFIPNSGNYIDAGSIGDYSDAEAHLYNVEATSTFGKVKVNRSVSTIDSSNAHSSYSGNLYLGIRFNNTLQFDGDIAEVIIYNSILSESDRRAVESYLMKKYAIQNYGEVDQSLTGSQGWRLMSSPVADSSYSTLFKGRWTQGMTGAAVSGGTPSVYTWSTATTTSDASNWNALGDLNSAYTPGSGVLAYLFSDDNGPDEAGDAGFPKIMNVEGIEPQNDQMLTSLLNTNVNGWTLLGNPFMQDVDWDSFTKTNLSNSVYVWDNNSSDWKAWNGSLGDLSDGEIGAFNGFFVQTTGANPTLEVPQTAKTGNKTRFLGKQVQKTQTPWLSLKLNNSELANELWVMFSDEAQTGIDNLDALKLQPLSADYVLLATKADSILLDINALPFTEKEIRLPLHLESTNMGEHTIELSGIDVPEGWEISLHDTQLDITTDLSEAYSFEIGSKQKRAPQAVSILHTPRLKQAQSDASGDERFVLIITPSSAVANEAINDLPSVLELSQNYPNPFNPSSVIEFSLPQNALVSLQVFDVLGRKVAELINQQTMEAGYHSIRFDGSSLASGVYIYRLQVGNNVLSKKLTLIK